MKKEWSVMFLLTVFGLLSLNRAWAQWHDDFEGTLDIWHGDRDCFVLDSGRLCSRGPEKKSVLHLSRRFWEAGDSGGAAFRQGVMNGDSALCFGFGIRLGFVPSTTNRLRLYLFSQDSMPEDTTYALYLQLGQKGSENRWQLFLAAPDTNFMLHEGVRLYSKQKDMNFNLRVVYRPQKSVAGNGQGMDGGGWLHIYRSEVSEKPVWERDGDSVFLDFVERLFFHTATPFYSGLTALYQTASRCDKYAFEYAGVGAVPVPETGRDLLRIPDSALEAVYPEPFFLYHRPSSGSLAINEVLFNPKTGESRFVEIRNLSDTLFDIGRLALAVPGDKKWKCSPLFKEGLHQMPAYGYRAFAKDAGGISPHCRSVPQNILTAASFPTLNEKGGSIRLLWLPLSADTLNDTVVIDEVFYSEEFHHWLLPDVKGVSLERLDAYEPALTQANWASAAETAGFATPGGENSHQRHARQDMEAAYFMLEPPLVTPNNDGRNDILFIRWNERLSGCVCSITVYDENGRKMRTVCTQTLLGSGGEIRYDAVDDSGRPLRPGLYVIYIDLIRPDRKHKRLRYPLPVG